MFQGDLASINGRDRTEAFNECMKKNYPGITVFGEADQLGGAVAAQKLQIRLTAHPDIKGIYMQASFALAGTLQLLKQKDLLVPPGRPEARLHRLQRRHPRGAQDIAAGKIDATVSQPADLYAKYALYYLKAAIEGKTFKPGPTDHDSTIIQVRDGVLEDQLSAPLVTRTAAPTAACPASRPTTSPVGQQHRLTLRRRHTAASTTGRSG